MPRKCHHQGRKTEPSFGVGGSNSVEFCSAAYKRDGMANLRTRCTCVLKWHRSRQPNGQLKDASRSGQDHTHDRPGLCNAAVECFVRRGRHSSPKVALIEQLLPHRTYVAKQTIYQLCPSRPFCNQSLFALPRPRHSPHAHTGLLLRTRSKRSKDTCSCGEEDDR